MSKTEINKTKRKDILQVDPRNLVTEEGFNARVDMGDIEALKDSIVESGLEVPLKACKKRGTDSYTVVDGHRRLMAIMMAIEQGHDIKYVDVISTSTNIEERTISMIITGTGQKPLTEMETAEAISRLVKFGYSPEEISKKIGKAIASVYNLITLSSTPKRVKNMVHDGLISGTTVVQIVREVKDDSGEVDAEKLLETAEKAVADAKAEADATGKKQKKATAKNVKSLKAKSPQQKLVEVQEALEKEGAKGSKVQLLSALNEALKAKASVEELIQLFK
jgi:ParB family chromosome partitioning protein